LFARRLGRCRHVAACQDDNVKQFFVGRSGFAWLDMTRAEN